MKNSEYSVSRNHQSQINSVWIFVNNFGHNSKTHFSSFFISIIAFLDPYLVPPENKSIDISNSSQNFEGIKTKPPFLRFNTGFRRSLKMGQYYKPVIITFKDGKLVVLAWMEAWDYGEGHKQMEHSYLESKFVQIFEWLISPEGPHHKAQVVWAGDYGAKEPGYEDNLYNLCNKDNQITPPVINGAIADNYPLVVNHTKRCYFDKRKVQSEIHPMPILTNETDSGGGGDYRGTNEHLMGNWARDELSVEAIAPEGFKEEEFEFEE
jgi:hypothetical protein